MASREIPIADPTDRVPLSPFSIVGNALPSPYNRADFGLHTKAYNSPPFAKIVPSLGGQTAAPPLPRMRPLSIMDKFKQTVMSAKPEVDGSLTIKIAPEDIAALKSALGITVSQ